MFILLFMRLVHIKDTKLFSLLYVRIFFPPHGEGLISSVCANLDVLVSVSVSSSS